jgi:plasmid stabilization system protein ParE
LAYSIEITLLARRDAQAYAAFVRDLQRSPDAARRWLDGLYAAIKSLAESPHRFAVIPESEELGFAYRSLTYYSHRVIYAVYDHDQRIVVHRIYHGARRPLTGRDLPSAD